MYIVFYFQNVEPEPTENCGPYSPSGGLENTFTELNPNAKLVDQHNHDTIGFYITDKISKQILFIKL